MKKPYFLFKAPNIFTISALFSISLLIVSCGGGLPATELRPETPPAPQQTRTPTAAPKLEQPKLSQTAPALLGQSFTLRPGETYSLTGSGVEITFVEISADSRCPETVECIIAGWVTATIIITVDGEQSRAELHAGAPLADMAVEIPAGAYTLRMIDVSPYPQEPGKISSDDYSAEFVLE